MEARLRREAKVLLEQGNIDCIIGFEKGSLRFTTTPLITKNVADLDRLVFNPFIANNLSVYLTQLTGRIGIVVKGCDSRSIVNLIQDNKIARKNVTILGVPCAGIIDTGKIEQLVGKDRDEIDEITRQGNRVTVIANGNRKEFSLGQVFYDTCLGCESPTPKECDILLGEPTAPLNDPSASRRAVAALKRMTPEQRWEFWKKEFSRCIRCYACRSACPACFCQRCFVEESEPQWVSPLPRWQENLFFQVIRNIHVAGRCTDCGQCERACPVNIPLRSLSREMYDIVGELFHYQAGTDKDATPLLTGYESTDPEDVFR